jgi:hypothetical protein
MLKSCSHFGSIRFQSKQKIDVSKILYKHRFRLLQKFGHSKPVLSQPKILNIYSERAQKSASHEVFLILTSSFYMIEKQTNILCKDFCNRGYYVKITSIYFIALRFSIDAVVGIISANERKKETSFLISLTVYQTFFFVSSFVSNKIFLEGESICNLKYLSITVIL